MTDRNHKKHKGKNLLRGLLFDGAGRAYVPTYANKPGKQYRYYRLHEKEDTEGVLDRLPAHEIETRIEEALRHQLAGFDTAAALLGINPHLNPDLIQMLNQKQACLPGRDLVLAAVQKVTIDHESITVQVKLPKLSAFISEQLRIGMPQAFDETREIKTSYITRRAHKGSIMIEADKGSAADKDPLDLPPGELRSLVRGLIWRDEHFSGMTLRDIGKREGFSEGYVGKCIFRSLIL